MRRRLLLSAGSTPVLIYKGAQPWAPLGQAKAFAVKTSPKREKGEEVENEIKNGKFIHPPHAAILDDFEGSGEEPEMSHSNDYEVPEHDENSDLHESLRQPLKRLSDRQLSVLLKQIRGQRRKQQENEAATDENIKEEQSRKSMLTELHSLLRSPLNGEKLRRPKLLTNINIIPKEWNIYPPKQINEDINKEEIVNNLNKINETVGNVIIKQNEENEINLLPEVSIDNITRSENITEENLKEENEHKSIENTTTEITTKTEASKTITEEASTVEIVSKEKTISEDRLKEKDMADNAEFKRTTEQIKIASKTTKMPNILSSSTDNLLHSAEIAPIDNLAKLETNKVKEKEEKTQSKQQKSINKQKQSKQTTKTTFESKKSTNKDEQRITRLTAHWRVVEQKIANEMNDAIKNSSKIIAEAEKQQKLIKGKKGNSITFASKTFNPTENVENDNKKEEFEDFKTAQFTALSTQLKQIRQRYEALKRQYLAKLKWLKSKKEGREKNEKGVKRLDRMKAAGAPTFLNAAELDLEKVGMRRNKAELNSTIEENNNQNDTIINQPNIDNNKTENEEHRVIESELEELKHEEEFATKIISGNKELNEELKTEATTLVNPIGGQQTILLASDKEINENTTDTVTTVEVVISTISPKKKKKKTHQESKQKKKKNKKPSLKSTLAELADELNKLDEKLFGDNTEVQINSTIKDETEKKEEKNKLIPKAKNLPKKKKQKIQKQEQLKKSSRINSSPDLSLQQLPIKQLNISQTKHNASQLQKLELPLKQTINNVDKQTQKIPSASHQSKSIQTTGRRILTAEWNPRTLLSDDNYEQETLNNKQSVPLKLSEGNHGIAHQLDLPPSSSINYQQQQSLSDTNRKSIKKSGKHNKTSQHQKHSGQQKQNGFYQLDKAQVANVIPKKNQITPDNADFKLKGVSQVQVKASPEQLEENELEEQLKNEQKNKLKEGKEKKKKNKKKNKKGGGKLIEEEKEEEELIDELANLEDFARIDEQTICDAIACDFETGTLCEWEASMDELNPSDPRYKRYLMARRQQIMERMMRKKMLRRSRRSTEKIDEEQKLEEEQKISKKSKNKKKVEKKKGKKKNKKENTKRILKEENNQTVILRTWHNWVGQYKNKLTGIAKSDFFSTRNQRFAASYLKPGQRSILTGRVLSGEQANISFWVWEATRDLQLRVCCDDTSSNKHCVFQTDKGVKRGSRRWIEQTATCPQGTKKVK